MEENILVIEALQKAIPEVMKVIHNFKRFTNSAEFYAKVRKSKRNLNKKVYIQILNEIEGRFSELIQRSLLVHSGLLNCSQMQNHINDVNTVHWADCAQQNSGVNKNVQD